MAVRSGAASYHASASAAPFVWQDPQHVLARPDPQAAMVYLPSSGTSPPMQLLVL